MTVSNRVSEPSVWRAPGIESESCCHECTVPQERVELSEGTEVLERVKSGVSTVVTERADPRVSTIDAERADPNESTSDESEPLDVRAPSS
jgi:hypothetical protein